MKKGAYVLIFFFWALITFITPTLFQWSAATAVQLQLIHSKHLITVGCLGTKGEGLLARKMMATLVRECQQRKPKLEEYGGGMKSAPLPAAVTPPAAAPAAVLKSMRKVEGTLQKELESPILRGFSGKMVRLSR